MDIKEMQEDVDNIDLEDAFKIMMQKYRTRDANRWIPKKIPVE